MWAIAGRLSPHQTCHWCGSEECWAWAPLFWAQLSTHVLCFPIRDLLYCPPQLPWTALCQNFGLSQAWLSLWSDDRRCCTDPLSSPNVGLCALAQLKKWNTSFDSYMDQTRLSSARWSDALCSFLDWSAFYVLLTGQGTSIHRKTSRRTSSWSLLPYFQWGSTALCHCHRIVCAELWVQCWCQSCETRKHRHSMGHSASSHIDSLLQAR